MAWGGSWALSWGNSWAAGQPDPPPNPWGGSWSLAWGNSWSARDVAEAEVKGGIYDQRDVERYRKYLEELTEATSISKRFVDKKPKAAKEVAKIANRLPIKTPEIKKLSQNKKIEIDYEKINNEISLIYDYINRKIKQLEAESLRRQYRAKQEEEAELVLLMCI